MQTMACCNTCLAIQPFLQISTHRVAAPIAVLATVLVEVQRIQGGEVLQQGRSCLEGMHLCIAPRKGIQLCGFLRQGRAAVFPAVFACVAPSPNNAMLCTCVWQAQIAANGGHRACGQRHPAAQVHMPLVLCRAGRKGQGAANTVVKEKFLLTWTRGLPFSA